MYSGVASLGHIKAQTATSPISPDFDCDHHFAQCFPSWNSGKNSTRGRKISTPNGGGRPRLGENIFKSVIGGSRRGTYDGGRRGSLPHIGGGDALGVGLIPPIGNTRRPSLVSMNDHPNTIPDMSMGYQPMYLSAPEFNLPSYSLSSSTSSSSSSPLPPEDQDPLSPPPYNSPQSLHPHYQPQSSHPRHRGSSRSSQERRQSRQPSLNVSGERDRCVTPYEEQRYDVGPSLNSNLRRDTNGVMDFPNDNFLLPDGSVVDGQGNIIKRPSRR